MTPIPIVALDVPNQETALALVDELGDACRFYKVGAELFTASGPKVVREVRARGADVFLDLKYHDIPNTVAGGVRRAAELGVRLLTVHASGGGPMLEAAVKAVGDQERCAVLAVTLLTSLDRETVAAVWGRDTSLDMSEEVMRLAELATEKGVAGVVCGGHEAACVKRRYGASLAVLIPGIRMVGGAPHDQARSSTPADAVAAGADYVVVGRAVTAAADRASAMRELMAQLT
ncbi:MAG TPA: orotidine-5'-phosphate decarboxylase [Gemmatimonadaceae bacterium]|nr:orotidine-5'-phosphate decarboxylase [Gemmatimonadaceae bacterium]